MELVDLELGAVIAFENPYDKTVAFAVVKDDGFAPTEQPAKYKLRHGWKTIVFEG